jgi:hypothetical protein
MLHSEYREKSEIRWIWTKHGKALPAGAEVAYSNEDIGDWFRGGQATIEKAEAAATGEDADHILTEAATGEDADHILTEAYLGDDARENGLYWDVCFYMPGRLS